MRIFQNEKTTMKLTKKLIAASVAAALALPALTAHAESSVQLYGLLGMYLGHMHRSGTAASVTQLGQGGLVTSYIGFRGTEDLGGGLHTIFALEAWLQPDNGAAGRSAADPFFSRNSYVGFEGGFGRATAGRQTNPTYLQLGAVSAFGGSTVFSPLILQSFIATYGNTIIGDTVWNNTLQYTSPRWNGLAFTGIYGLGEVPDRNGVSNVGLHANYANGPLTAVFSSQRVRTPVTAPMTQQNATIGGVAYDFKLAKLFASLGHTSAEGVRNETHTSSLGVRVPAGSGAVMAEWARTRRETTGSTTRDTGSLGYDYFLSKRTDLYLVYSRDRLTAFSPESSVALGVRHTF
jgi:predicted porin